MLFRKIREYVLIGDTFSTLDQVGVAHLVYHQPERGKSFISSPVKIIPLIPRERFRNYDGISQELNDVVTAPAYRLITSKSLFIISRSLLQQ